MKRTKPSAKPFLELWPVKALTLEFGGWLQWLLVIDLFRNQHCPLSNPPSQNQLPSPQPQLFFSKLVLRLRPGKSVSPMKWSFFFDPIGFYVYSAFFFLFRRVGGELGCVQSLLPLHSAVSSARLTSCLGIDSSRSRSLSQGMLCSANPGVWFLQFFFTPFFSVSFIATSPLFLMPSSQSN